MQEETASECPICLQPLLYPVKLPCNHLFCFLCVKGIRNPLTTKACAMCRQPFSIAELEQSLEIDCLDSSKVFKWFYEGKTSGYWAFDERSNLELEKAYDEKKEKIVISIAGFAYCIDFNKLIQYPTSHPERIRKIKRSEEHSLDSGEFKIKGIAGLRVTEKSDQAGNSSSSNTNQCDDGGGASGTSTDQLSQSLSESLQLNKDT